MPLNPKSTTPNGDEQNVPLWRKQFPIDADDEATRSRREFLGGLTIAGGAMACGQVALEKLSPADGMVSADAANSADGQSVGSVATPESAASETAYPPLILPKKLTELADGEAMLFHYPHEKSPCLLVKFADDDFVAFAQKCTHLACPVIPDDDNQTFHCPCHHGSFDLRSGKPLAGPPRAPLPAVRVEVASDGTLTATGIG